VRAHQGVWFAKLVPRFRHYGDGCTPLRTRLTHGHKPSAGLSALAFCVLVILPSTAAAGNKDLYATLRFQIDGSPRGCWDEAKFRRGVARRIGYDPFRKEAAFEVRIHVGGSASAVDGQVEWRDANGAEMGERTFVAKDGNCGKLMTEMGFAVSLQIEFLRLKTPKPAPADVDLSARSPTPDPNSASIGDESAPAAPSGTEESPPVTDAPSAPPAPITEAEPKPEPVEKPQPEAPAESAEPSPSEPSPPWSMWVGGGPSLAWRLSPGLTADGRLYVGLRRGVLSFELAAEATYPSTIHQGDGTGFRHTLLGTTLAVCGHIDWFSACALGRASQVRVTGLGVDQPRQPHGFVGQAGARVAMTLPMAGPWSVAAHLDGLGLLTTSTVHLNQTPVWEMPRFGTVVGVDVLAHFR
jgi:hypothetical protein